MLSAAIIDIFRIMRRMASNLPQRIVNLQARARRQGPGVGAGPRMCEATPTAGPTLPQALEVATPKRAPLPVTASFSVLHNTPPPGWPGSSHEVGHGGFWTTQRGLKPPSFMSKELLPDCTERRVLQKPSFCALSHQNQSEQQTPPLPSSPHPQ